MPRHLDAWGRVWFHSSDAVELLMQGTDITQLLIKPDADTAAYNRACQQHNKDDYCLPEVSEPDQSPEDDTARRLATWLIPDDYREIDVRQRLLTLCRRDDEVSRVHQEMDMFEARGLVPVLRLMIYLVDHFRKHDIVWGVGRGSSVASYCLFLLGVHRIDALAYDLPISEFLR